MTVDIVIPAYNEEDIIAETVRDLRAVVATLAHTVRVVVADNGSADKTSLVAQEAGADVLAVPTRGKGAALIYAAQQSVADCFVFIDADLSASPTEIAGFLTLLERGEADLVIGSRLLAPATVHRSFFRTATSRAFNLLRRVLLGLDVQDTQCGLKAMNEAGRTLLAQCRETGWFLDMELLARAERKGLSIKEVPVEWEEFRYSNRTSKLNVVRDGIAAVAAMMRIRTYLS